MIDSFYLVCGIATIIPMKRQRPSSSSPLLLLLQNSGFYNTDNTDASLLLSHPSTSTSTTTNYIEIFLTITEGPRYTTLNERLFVAATARFLEWLRLRVHHR